MESDEIRTRFISFLHQFRGARIVTEITQIRQHAKRDRLLITRATRKNESICYVCAERWDLKTMGPYRLSVGLFLISYCLPVSVLAVDVDSYLAQRQHILDQEAGQVFGSGLTLDAQELAANSRLMQVKQREYDQAVANLKFPPAMHFFQAKPLMLQSEVYEIIRRMPKGLFRLTEIEKKVKSVQDRSSE
jgi:Adenosine/AMP deaminase N-terminal